MKSNQKWRDLMGQFDQIISVDLKNCMNMEDGPDKEKYATAQFQSFFPNVSFKNAILSHQWTLYVSDAKTIALKRPPAH